MVWEDTASLDTRGGDRGRPHQVQEAALEAVAEVVSDHQEAPSVACFYHQEAAQEAVAEVVSYHQEAPSVACIYHQEAAQEALAEVGPHQQSQLADTPLPSGDLGRPPHGG